MDGWCRANTHLVLLTPHRCFDGAVGWHSPTHAEQADGNKRVDAEEALEQVDCYYGGGEVDVDFLEGE